MSSPDMMLRDATFQWVIKHDLAMDSILSLNTCRHLRVIIELLQP